MTNGSMSHHLSAVHHYGAIAALLALRARWLSVGDSAAVSQPDLAANSEFLRPVAAKPHSTPGATVIGPPSRPSAVLGGDLGVSPQWAVVAASARGRFNRMHASDAVSRFRLRLRPPLTMLAAEIAPMALPVRNIVYLTLLRRSIVLRRRLCLRCRF